MDLYTVGSKRIIARFWIHDMDSLHALWGKKVNDCCMNISQGTNFADNSKLLLKDSAICRKVTWTKNEDDENMEGREKQFGRAS